ncbi:MAG TPA: alpha/beta hydrolase [Rhizobiaceae bacterium]|nr:alpha/beta hydrolase [Rhizobiaceae bacterium]
MIFRLATVLAALLTPLPAAAAELAPFKDDLFAYPAILATADNGDHITLDYQELRDINERDEIPERRVKRKYVSLGVRDQQQDMALRTDAGEVRHMVVGKTTGAKFITLYIYGQGGSRKQGMDDFTFGGNFNRIKNLMAGNGGLYVTPDFTEFGAKGAAQVAAVIDHYAAQSPGAPVFVACGSMGGAICWELAKNASVAKKLGGLLLLGSHWDDSFLSSAAFKRGVPVFFGHGGSDKVFAVEKQEAFFRSIRAKKPGYPAKFVRFETGSHGTPIRMTDWRSTLNWMLSAKP